MLNQLAENLCLLTTVQVGSIVHTFDKKYFIASHTGGIKVLINKDIYQVVSIRSPIVKRMIDGDIDIEDVL